jgi:creatinine amidohydrolase/Fe(II)-dependent formamide hydrolase-like protein
MAEYGLGNFVYELEVSDGSANFKFRDPDDASNTAEVSVHQSDFPEGINQADSRQVADLAFAQCSKVLNDKRDKRLHAEASEDLAAKQKEDARAREAAADFHNNSQELADTTPTGSEGKQEEAKAAPAHNPDTVVGDDSKKSKKDK